jgi:hypothetical protein
MRNISVKVSEKGAVSVYGLRRFPVTLYRDEMEAILDKADAIRAFMKANASRLTTKSEGTRAPEGATSL